MTFPELLSRYLRQQRELGEQEVFLDRLTAEEAVDILSGKRRVVPAPRPAAPPVEAAVTAAPPPPSPAAGGREDRAAALRVLRQEAEACTRCRLHQTRTTVVFGEGNPAAEVVVVGEAPGAEEDRAGRPFVGRAGKLLDRLLLSVGLPREDVFICNVLKCRPPQNRDPLPDEVDHCVPFLRGQIAAIAPRVLLAVGKHAVRVLTGSEASIGQLRGRIHVYDGIPLVATYHPAYLLRSPHQLRTAWQDFQLLRQVLDETE